MMPQSGTQQAHSTLATNLTRSRHFLVIHRKIQDGPGSPPTENRELPRGALVFAVGALDTFIGDWSSSVIIEAMKHGTLGGDAKVVLNQVQKRMPSLALEVALIPTAKERLRFVDESIADYFYSQTSNHGAKAVSAAVELSGNAPKDFWSEAAKRCGPSPQSKLDEWTKKRHRIVHRGERVPVQRDHAESCIKLIEGIGETMMGLGI